MTISYEAKTNLENCWIHDIIVEKPNGDRLAISWDIEDYDCGNKNGILFGMPGNVKFIDFDSEEDAGGKINELNGSEVIDVQFIDCIDGTIFALSDLDPEDEICFEFTKLEVIDGCKSLKIAC